MGGHKVHGFCALRTNILPTNEVIIDHLYLQCNEFRFLRQKIISELTKYCSTTNVYPRKLPAIQYLLEYIHGCVLLPPFLVMDTCMGAPMHELFLKIEIFDFDLVMS